MEKIAIQAVILAAGRGKRMLSKKPKILFRIGGKPILQRSIELACACIPNPPIAVISDNKTIKALCTKLGATISLDLLRNGTANGLKAALSQISAETRYLLVYNSDDSYLYSKNTIDELIATHLKEGNHATIQVVKPECPYPDIRKVFIDDKNRFLGFLPKESDKGVISCGCYILNRDWAEKLLPQVTPNPNNQEYQITCLFELGLEARDKIGVSFLRDSRRWWGINTRRDLITARKLWKKLNH